MFKLYDLNMNEIKMSDGLIPLDIYIESIRKEIVSESVEGRSGRVNQHSVYRDRRITLNLMMKARDTQDYRLLRDESQTLFNKGVFYVVEKYQPGKRYKIETTVPYIPERPLGHQRFATLTIDCETTELPFAESIGTSADIDHNGILYSQELWSYGMGLLHDEESHKYTHNTNTFRVYNPGNVAIHPFEQHLKITIDNAPGQVTLRNNTTGDEFKYNENLNNRKLVLDGPNITVNSLQALRDTNKKFITLAPGWNEFTSIGGAKVNFDFRFYYL